MPTTVNASIVTKPVVAKVANNDIDPYLSISVSLLPYLTQTFAFDGVGFHCLTRKDNLIPFVLNKSSRKCQKIDRFEATGLNGHLISIDGELYKADAVEGVLLEAAETQEETKVEIIEEKPSPGNNYVIGKKMFLGRVLRIA